MTASTGATFLRSLSWFSFCYFTKIKTTKISLLSIYIYTHTTHTIYRAVPLGIWAVHLDLAWFRWGRSSQQRRAQCKALPTDLEFKLVLSESTYLSIWTSDIGCPILFTAFCVVNNQPCEHFLPVRSNKAFQSPPKMAKQNRKLLKSPSPHCTLL